MQLRIDEQNGDRLILLFDPDDTPLPLFRNGYLEECFFTLSYGPIREESGSIGGVLGVVHETTDQVLAQRRLSMLRELAGSPPTGLT